MNGNSFFVFKIKFVTGVLLLIYNSTVTYSTVLYGTVRYGIIRYISVQYSTMLKHITDNLQVHFGA